MKILITGGFGQLGQSLNDELLKKNYEVILTGFGDFDITDKKSIQNGLEKYKPDWVINCASYTNVDLAENEPQEADMVNGYAAGLLAEETFLKKIKLIHLSTDYVFGDNKKKGHKENDEPGNNQLNQYGKSKRFGEIEAQRNNKNAYIIRTSWMYGSYGKSFVKTMIDISKNNKELNIVDDEVGVPTPSSEVAKSIIHIIEHQDEVKPGIYHAVCEGSCSRFDEAKKIFAVMNINIKLNKIKLTDFARAAKVPNYSILLNTKLPKLPKWDTALENFIKEKYLT